MTAPSLTPAALAELERLYDLHVDRGDGPREPLGAFLSCEAFEVRMLPKLAAGYSAAATIVRALPGLVAAVRERDRMREALEVIAGRGCEAFVHGERPRCTDRDSGRGLIPCPSCVARRALGGVLSHAVSLFPSCPLVVEVNNGNGHPVTVSVAMFGEYVTSWTAPGTLTPAGTGTTSALP